jgi:predicted amidohydrolase
MKPAGGFQSQERAESLMRINVSAALLVAAAAFAVTPGPASAEELIPNDGSCWKRFAPRAQTAPAGELRTQNGRYALTLVSGGKEHAYGGWRCRIDGIEPGRYYRLRAQALPQGFTDLAGLRESVGVQVRWRGDFGGAVAPSYVWEVRQLKDPAGAYEFDRVLQAPPKTRAVELELVLQWTPTGQVEWQSISLQPDAAPAPRKVRVAAVWLRPRNSRTGADSVQRFAEYVDRIAPQHHPDVIVLGEMINRVGVSGDPDQQAEPIPGPTTEAMSEQARRHRSWITFSIVERDGPNLFNTAVLIDRTGRIAGKYRKVQLPFEEVSIGIAPGSDFPVFETDFGKVGLLICHDASFPEAARELSLKGAEIILMPIWGGRTTLVRARAMENGVYVVTSGYDYPSEIIAPTGDVLAGAPIETGPAVAVAEIDLSQRFRQDWIGDWNDSYQRQQRPSAYKR